MERLRVYYLAWEEDEWLDELIDYFSEVTALVPSQKNLQLISQEQEDNAVFVVNPAKEAAKTRQFLQGLTALPELSRRPLYIVGINEQEAAQWQAEFPQAEVIVITGFLVEFDFAAVFARMEEAGRDDR